MPTVRMFLVRHASAGQRKDWPGDDGDRPLDAVGRAQAAAVAQRLAHLAPHAVLTSPALRCVQTVAPLAEALGTTSQVVNWLAVDALEAAVPSLLDLVGEMGTAPAVLCTHGEVLTAVLPTIVPPPLRHWLDSEPSVPPPPGAKAGIWWLDWQRGAVQRFGYWPPPVPGS